MRRPPPPRWRTVMRPWLLRPARLGSFSRRLFSGFERVTSSKLEVAMNRRPGLVGLYLRTGILDPSEQSFQLAGGQGHHGLLPVRGPPPGPATTEPAHLAVDPDGVHAGHLHALRLVVLLQGPGDLRLGGVVRNPERVTPLLEEGVGALADDGPQDDLGRRSAHGFTSSEVSTASSPPEASPDPPNPARAWGAKSSAISPTASFVINSRSCVKRSYRFRLWARIGLAQGRLLIERATTWLGAGRTTSADRSTPTRRRNSTMGRVRGSSKEKPSSTATLPSATLMLSAERRASRRIFRGIRWR